MVSFICPLLCRIILPMDLKLEWVAAVLGIHESLLWLPHLGPPTVKAGILLCYFFISSHPDSLHKFPWQSFTRIAPPSNPSAMQENLSSSLTWLCQQMHMTLPFVYYVFMPKRKLSWSFHLNTLIMLLFFRWPILRILITESKDIWQRSRNFFYHTRLPPPTAPKKPLTQFRESSWWDFTNSILWNHTKNGEREKKTEWDLMLLIRDFPCWILQLLPQMEFLGVWGWAQTKNKDDISARKWFKRETLGAFLGYKCLVTKNIDQYLFFGKKKNIPSNLILILHFN